MACIVVHDAVTKQSPLGIKQFLPNLKHRTFISQMKNDCSKYMERLGKRYGNRSTMKSIFNLGCGGRENDPGVAAEKVVAREYPEIWNNTQDKVVFIPESYFRTKNTAAMIEDSFTDEQLQDRAVYESESPSLQKKQQKTSALQLEATDIAGDLPEGFLFSHLQQLFIADTESTDDIVVIHSLDIQEKSFQHEFDFLLLLPKRKLIVQVEVKNSYLYTHTNRGKKVKKALRQLKSGRSIIQSFFHDVLDDTWNFIDAIYFHELNLEEEKLCDACSHWILSDNTNFQQWWSQIVLQFPVKDVNEQVCARIQFKTLFSYLVFIMHKNDGPISPSKASERIYNDMTGKIGTPENILFWSKDQRDLLKNDANKNVMFTSIYGSGKTLLMRAKAEQLALQGQKVAYIMWAYKSSNKTLLHVALEEQWKQPVFEDNIKVLTSIDIKEDASMDVRGLLCSSLLSYMQRHPLEHIMVDEWFWDFNKDTIENFQKCVDEAGDKCLWVTWHKNTVNNWNTEFLTDIRNFSENFVMADLRHSMRNTRLIIEEAKKVAGVEGHDILVPSSCYLAGLPPKYFLLDNGRDNDQVKATFQNALEAARLRTDSGIVVVINDFQTSGLDSVQIRAAINAVKDICLERNESCFVYFLRSEYQSESSGDVRKFIAENDGILIADHSAAEGFEAETIISYGGLDEDTANYSSTNLFMRCISNLIVIEEPLHVKEKRKKIWIEYNKKFWKDNSKFDVRLKSFDNWPATAVQKQACLAQVGFFYLGTEDYVRCFTCNSRIGGWREEDDPLTRHSCASPGCGFIKDMKVNS